MSTESIEVSNDNIIGALYNIIYKLKNTDGENSEDIFSKVFSLDKNDKAAIMNSYAELFKMCNLAIEQIEQFQPKNIVKYKGILNNVIEGFSKIYFNASPGSVRDGMDEFESYFNKEMMTSIEICAYYLSEQSNEICIEDEKIQELIEEINGLIQEILKSELNKDLKRILVYQLNNVRESLLKYKLFGAEGIINNIATTLGTLMLNIEKANDKQSKFTLKNIFGFIGKVNAIISFKSNSINLLTAISEKLTSIE